MLPQQPGDEGAETVESLTRELSTPQAGNPVKREVARVTVSRLSPAGVAVTLSRLDS